MKKKDWADKRMDRYFKTWGPLDGWLPHFTKALRAHHRRIERAVLKMTWHGEYFEGMQPLDRARRLTVPPHEAYITVADLLALLERVKK